MQELARSVMVEIELRAELLAHREAQEQLVKASRVMDERNRKLVRMTLFCRATIDQLFEVVQRDDSKERLIAYLQAARKELGRHV